MRYLLTGFVGLLALGLFYSCQKELSVEYGSAAKGSLQSSAGDCLPKNVGGGYTAAKALTDSNYLDVTVNVSSPGPYKIGTDTLNGYAFVATGTFANTGPTTVRLKGSGKPVTAGTDLFTVFFDSSFCDVEVTVLPAGSSGGPAVYTLGGAGGACTPTPFTPSGNYVKDTTLNATNFVTVNVNVTAVGTYSLNTTTVNGYFFAATGTFSTTGPQTVKLPGSGKPAAAGTDAFTLTGGSAGCTFSVTVTATAPASCTPTVQGTYTVGTANTTANKVTLTHTYASAGSVAVSTNTVNGYSFGPSTVNATAGANTITLIATGTPTAAGTDNFTVSFGDGQTCSFTVTVTGVINPDYFPTTQNSWWTYDDVAASDTFKVTVSGTQVFTVSSTPQTYQKFVYSDALGPYFTEYYRKDAAATPNVYYQSIDTGTVALGKYGIFFPAARFEVMFLKNTLTAGASWNSDQAVTLSGIPSTLRFKFKCIDATLPHTVGGKTFTNVYKIEQVVQLINPLLPSGSQDLTGAYHSYYAKGVGLIDAEDDTPASFQTIRFWQVN